MFQVGNKLTGKYLLLDINFTKTSTGSNMISCSVVEEGGESLRSVSFDAGVVNTLKQLGVSTIEADIILTVQDYNGSMSGKITNLMSVYEPDMSKYLESLDIKIIAKELISLLKEHLSPKGAKLAFTILQNHNSQLKTAMAAMYGGYHDGIQGGLLNHIRKLLRYGGIAMNEYEAVFTSDEKDLVLIGLLVHDLGKIIEIENGAYSKMSIVPHTYWGIEILSEHKEDIVKTYSEMFYVELQAIILEHHGEFGERPKTIYAYLVHVIDLLDSRVSGLYELLKTDAPEHIKFDGYRLQFNRYGG